MSAVVTCRFFRVAASPPAAACVRHSSRCSLGQIVFAYAGACGGDWTGRGVQLVVVVVVSCFAQAATKISASEMASRRFMTKRRVDAGENPYPAGWGHI